MFGEHLAQLVRERDQPLGQRRLGIGFDLAIGDMRQAIAIGDDDAPAG
jgi:hypothetical protein